MTDSELIPTLNLLVGIVYYYAVVRRRAVDFTRNPSGFTRNPSGFKMTNLLEAPIHAGFQPVDSSYKGITKVLRRVLQKRARAKPWRCITSVRYQPHQAPDQLCGSDNKQMFSFRQELRHALDRMAEVTGWTCEVNGDDLVHVAKTGTASQQKHLIAAHGKVLIKKLSTNRGA